MDITTEAGRRAWSTIVAHPSATLLCTDFDGVLSPIVSDPDAAWASEETVTAVARLGRRIAKVVVITGRMARKAVRLGHLDERTGLESMTVLGLYGFERWDAATGTFHEPEAPAGVEAAAADLPALLDRLGVGDARLEFKRLSVGVHTRELPDPKTALDMLREPLAELAQRHGLRLEPGKFVLELLVPGRDKGDALRRMVTEVNPAVVVFAGDDLGDVPAFEAVRELRDTGRVEGLLICSGSSEQDALVALSDVVVPGPDGVATLLERLAAEIEA